MKMTTNVETTRTVELTAQDVDAYIKANKLVPADWKFYSVDVAGHGISNGCTLTIKHSEAKST